MIKVIDIASKTRTPTPEGHVRTVLGPSENATRVEVAVKEVDPGKTCRLARSQKTQVVYLLEGNDATLTHTTAGNTAEYKAPRRAGVYLEPGEEASITASGTPLVLL